MFIRPWVKVLLKRMQNTDGRQLDRYRLSLMKRKQDSKFDENKMLLAFGLDNGFLLFRIDRWDGYDCDGDPHVKLRFFEYFAVYWRAQRLIAKINHASEATKYADMMAKLTGLEE